MYPHPLYLPTAISSLSARKTTRRNLWGALCTLLAAVSIALPATATAQAVLPQGEWVWQSGSGSYNQSASINNSLGAAAAANTPGSREHPATWTDTSGHLWLFGGFGYAGLGAAGELNDLWVYNTSTNQWTWISGSSTVGSNSGQPGVYGTQGTAAAANIPGGRVGALGWTDPSGNLWLFGGMGYDVNGLVGSLNDLWEYNTTSKQWTWWNGSSSVPSIFDGQPGIYGTQGTAAAANTPGGRSNTVGWTDPSGNLWLLGGEGLDANGDSDGTVDLNDLWKYNTSTHQWTWVGGSSTAPDSDGNSGVYGTLYTAAAANIPGGRDSAVSWTDKNGNFWLFGGSGSDANGTGGGLNDLWEYNTSYGTWAWMGGSSTLPTSGNIGIAGVYGTQGTPAAANAPGTRHNAASLVDASGNFWLFGGYSYVSDNASGWLNDLWEYQPATATLLSPTPGTTLTGSSATFTWSKGYNVSQYLLEVGTTGPGSTDLAESETTSTSYTVTDLPTNGKIVYVSLVSIINNTWKTIHYTYTAATVAAPATLLSPTPGSTLTSSTATFTWNAGVSATAYKLILGSAIGGSDLYNSYTTTATTATAKNLPSLGKTIYATLYSLVGGVWKSNAYTFTEATATTVPATLTSPTPSSTLTSSTVAFTWTAGTGVTAYKLILGTTAGASNRYNSYTTTLTSVTVKNLPTTGATLYATLYSLVGGVWKSNAYTFTEANYAPATLTSPDASTTLLLNSTATFIWSKGTGVTAYKLILGTTAGGSDLYNSYTTTATTATAKNLPVSNGNNIYARLYSLVNGVWLYTDTTYHTAP